MIREEEDEYESSAEVGCSVSINKKVTIHCLL